MGLFRSKHKQEIRADTVSYEDGLLQAMLGGSGITKTIAMQIPTVNSAVTLMGDIVAGTPIKLYQESEGKTKEVIGDNRIKLLNDETGDTLNANEFWRAIIRDYYLGKGGYAYINKQKGAVKSLHYVDDSYVAIQKNTDPIFKDYDILVNGSLYKPFDFIKLLHNTTDGARGKGIITENSKILEVAYETLRFESNLVKKGGNKKGYLKSKRTLTDAAMTTLKAAFGQLYSNNSNETESVLVLNDGMDFQESSNTSVEMQLNENKMTNSAEIGKIFHMSSGVISGNATEKEISSLAKLAVIPLFKLIECALNRDLLLEREKGSFYFAFDTKELLKGSLLERYQAYEIAIKNGWKTRNEIRYQEDDAAIEGMNIVEMSLGSVIYDIDSKKYFVPNTSNLQPIDMRKDGESSSEIIGGENNAS